MIYLIVYLSLGVMISALLCKLLKDEPEFAPTTFNFAVFVMFWPVWLYAFFSSFPKALKTALEKLRERQIRFRGVAKAAIKRLFRRGKKK